MNIEKVTKELTNFKFSKSKISRIKKFIKDPDNKEEFRYLNPGDVVAAFYYIFEFPPINVKNIDKEELNENLEATIKFLNKTKVDEDKMSKQKFQILSYISIILGLGFDPSTEDK